MTSALQTLCCTRRPAEPAAGDSFKSDCSSSHVAPELLREAPLEPERGPSITATKDHVETAIGSTAKLTNMAPPGEPLLTEGNAQELALEAATAAPAPTPQPPCTGVAAARLGVASSLSCGSGKPGGGGMPSPAGSDATACSSGGPSVGGVALLGGDADGMLSLDSFLGVTSPPRKSAKVVVEDPAEAPSPVLMLGSFLDPQQPWPGQEGTVGGGGGAARGQPSPWATQGQTLSPFS